MKLFHSDGRHITVAGIDERLRRQGHQPAYGSNERSTVAGREIGAACAAVRKNRIAGKQNARSIIAKRACRVTGGRNSCESQLIFPHRFSVGEADIRLRVFLPRRLSEIIRQVEPGICQPPRICTADDDRSARAVFPFPELGQMVEMAMRQKNIGNGRRFFKSAQHCVRRGGRVYDDTFFARGIGKQVAIGHQDAPWECKDLHVP